MKFISPMLCQLIEKPFDDKGWIFERKLDGVRFIAAKEGSGVTLWTRNKKDRTKQFPEIEEALKRIPGDFVIDGEAAVYGSTSLTTGDKKEVSSFQLIQPRVQQENLGEIKKLARDNPAVYEAFDLLILNGRDLKSQPLLKRKELLRKLIQESKNVKFLSHLAQAGKKLFKLAKQKGWEGIVGKKKDSRYLPGKRGHGWVKIKAVLEQELVIGGFTRGYGKVAGTFGALLVGYYQGDNLIFAGEVGTGYTEEERKMLREKLTKLKTTKSPFVNLPLIKEVTWVKPVLVGQFKFAEWTKDNILRVPVYLGLRTDKRAREVVKEG